MKAFVLPAFDSRPWRTSPRRSGPGRVLVRVRAASVNGFDLSVPSGRLRGMLEYRFLVVLGKDFAGTVEAVGDGVARSPAATASSASVSDPSPLHTGRSPNTAPCPRGRT